MAAAVAQLQEVLGPVPLWRRPATGLSCPGPAGAAGYFRLFRHEPGRALGDRRQPGADPVHRRADVRDRIESARRIRSNAAQSQMSTLAVLALTYFIALVMWRTESRSRLREFLATTVGQWARRRQRSSCRPSAWHGCRPSAA